MATQYTTVLRLRMLPEDYAAVKAKRLRHTASRIGESLPEGVSSGEESPC